PGRSAFAERHASRAGAHDRRPQAGARQAVSAPRLATVVAEWLVDPRLREAVIGDLEEIFASEHRANPMLARIVYWRRAIGLALRLRPTRSRRAVRHRLQQRRRDAVITMILKDMRHGARLFVKQPAFALAAIVTIGLAIGANTLIFTMANVLVFKPLPIREPDRLGWIFATGPDAISGRGPISLPEYTTY